MQGVPGSVRQSSDLWTSEDNNMTSLFIQKVFVEKEGVEFQQ